MYKEDMDTIRQKHIRKMKDAGSTESLLKSGDLQFIPLKFRRLMNTSPKDRI